MSFKSFSSAQTTQSKDKPADKAKDAKSKAQAAPKSDKNSTEAATPLKS